MIDQIFSTIARFVNHRPKLVVGIIGVIFVIALVGMTMITMADRQRYLHGQEFSRTVSQTTSIPTRFQRILSS